MQIYCILLLTLVNFSYCQSENAGVLIFKDPDADINAVLDISLPPMSGLFLFLSLSFISTLAFSLAMYAFVLCVKDHFNRRNPPLTVIV